MGISLGSITLPDLTIENEHSWTGVEAAVDLSLGGAPIVWERAVSGRPLDLIGGEDTGWITRAILNSLKALAAVPRATYTLIYEVESYTVRFRHEDGFPIEAVPVIPRPNQEDGDYYHYVRIRLMTL